MELPSWGAALRAYGALRAAEGPLGARLAHAALAAVDGSLSAARGLLGYGGVLIAEALQYLEERATEEQHRQ